MKCITCEIEMRQLGGVSHQCPNCSLISNEVSVDPSVYDRSYDIKYRRYEKTEQGDSLNRLRFALTYNLMSESNSTVLDFGCGSGSFVRYCKSKGVSIDGFDINPFSGYCTIETLFKQFDTVTFWDSLEHLVDPLTLITGLNTKNIIVCTPSTDDFEGPATEISKWHHFYVEEHIHYFNEKSLKRMLEHLGYSIQSVSYEESKIRCSGGVKNILTISGRRL